MRSSTVGRVIDDGVADTATVDDTIAQAHQLLEAIYGIDAPGASDVLRVCAHAVGLEVPALACRIVHAAGNHLPSPLQMDALLMDVEETLPGAAAEPTPR